MRQRFEIAEANGLAQGKHLADVGCYLQGFN